MRKKKSEEPILTVDIENPSKQMGQRLLVRLCIEENIRCLAA